MNSLRTAANHSSRGWPAATLWPRSPCCWARFYTYIPYRYTTLLYYFTIHIYCKSPNSWRRVGGDGQSEDSPMDRSQPTRRCSFACTKKKEQLYIVQPGNTRDWSTGCDSHMAIIGCMLEFALSTSTASWPHCRWYMCHIVSPRGGVLNMPIRVAGS